MSLIIENGDCLELMKELPDKSVDLFICDLPYGETNCSWDSKIDLEQFWTEFRRLRKSTRTACIHFCSTKFGYTLIKSWEKGYKMDMVWKKRNKTGGLQSRHRPMRNHEMVYFFYEQAPKYNRDKYHKRIQTQNVGGKKNEHGYDSKGQSNHGEKSFNPPNPASVVEEKFCKEYYETNKTGMTKTDIYSKEQINKFHKENGVGFDPPNPASVVEEDTMFGETKKERNKRYKQNGTGAMEPPNPASVLEEPVSMFESKKVFIGKRHHQTEKPLDILEFFLKYWTDEGDTVLDPTMGSGSTGVACKTLNRNFIGFELDETIFKVAEKRVNS